MEVPLAQRIKWFTDFDKCLKDAGIDPWYFPVVSKGKNPDGLAIADRAPDKSAKDKASWKAPHAKLAAHEVVQRYKQGGNVGIAARKEDRLRILDIDNPKYLDSAPGNTLTIVSRKRLGQHRYFLLPKDETKKNVPTGYGELREDDQYVLAPGSFVPFTAIDGKKAIAEGELTDEQVQQIYDDPFCGYYSLYTENLPRELPFNQMPSWITDQEKKDVMAATRPERPGKIKADNHKFFNIKISDIIGKLQKARVGHPLHSSDTDANFSVSHDGALGHCWRHDVSLSGWQYLAVMAGYCECQDAGKRHKSDLPSKILKDKKAWAAAFEKGKELGLFTDEDNPIKENKLPFAMFTDLLQMADNFIQSQPIYYDNNKMWWVWNFENNCWEQSDEINIMNELDDALQSGSATIRMRNEIIEALKRRARKARPKDLQSNYVQFKDIIVNIQTGEQIPASPEYFTTNPIPHKIGESEDTPNIDKLFKDWVVGGDQDESYVTTLYQVFAYSMLSDQFMQRLVALTGTGSNGKGCCLQMLIKFIGKQNICSTELAALANGRFEASGLYKKLVAVMGEADAFDLKNTNLIKQLSGQDLIKYEFKGKTPFTEESSTTCIISTNSLPITPDASDGFYRRWLVIEFPHQFKIGGDILSSVSDKEYENLARKCLRIAKEMYVTKSFANEGSIQQRRQKYEERSNPLAKFIETYCEDSTDRFIAFPIFYQAFSKYLVHQRLRAMSKRSVSKALRMENLVVKNVSYKKPEGDASTVLAIQDLQFKYIIFQNIENIENIEKRNRFYIGNELKIGYFRYFGYLEPPKAENPTEKQQQVDNLPTPEEEYVSDGTNAAPGEIHHKCNYCGLTPCVGFDRKGRPICELCMDNPNIKK